MSNKAIVLDANILIRAVLGKRVRELIFENAASQVLCARRGVCRCTKVPARLAGEAWREKHCRYEGSGHPGGHCPTA